MKLSYDALPKGDLAVYLDGKRVGTIITVAHGYRYFPITLKCEGGETFPTLAAVKQSLEMEP